MDFQPYVVAIVRDRPRAHSMPWPVAGNWSRQSGWGPQDHHRTWCAGTVQLEM